LLKEKIMAKPNAQKIGIGAGMITAGCLMLYFVLMKYANLIEVLGLRALNFFILLGGIIMALNKYRKSNDNNVPYLEGFGLGLLTTAVALIIFSSFIGIYLSFHPAFMNYIKEHALMGAYLNPSSAALAILVEGCISGLIISFSCMQYFKRFVNGGSEKIQQNYP
jgi:hypothetical protein